MFNMPFYQPIIAVAFACLTSVLAVRALGETDLNPVSGIGKMSQIVFAGVAPGNVVANLIAGAISEAGMNMLSIYIYKYIFIVLILCSFPPLSFPLSSGAQQAGDLMQVCSVITFILMKQRLIQFLLQDLKTGHLLRASPRAQFYAQLIGSLFSVFFTVAAYQLYSNAYTIPSDTLPAPTAAVRIPPPFYLLHLHSPPHLSPCSHNL
jgi:uncharacterized oligopeptide transporter (OPT) family protein